jgi:hypothetical protein
MIASDARRFLDAVVKKIPGWLEDYTAVRTMDLLSFQESQGINGPLLEIGLPTTGEGAILGPTTTPNPGNVG